LVVNLSTRIAFLHWTIVHAERKLGRYDPFSSMALRHCGTIVAETSGEYFALDQIQANAL
jgi:hypothetical protein